MIETNVLSILRKAKEDYDNSMKTKMNLTATKQRLTNILLSHAEELIETALDAEFLLKKKIELENKLKAYTDKEEVEEKAPSPTASPKGKKNG